MLLMEISENFLALKCISSACNGVNRNNDQSRAIKVVINTTEIIVLYS